MRVRLTQIDGSLPNLALMKLAHWHGARGDEIVFTGLYRVLPFSDYDSNTKRDRQINRHAQRQMVIV